jgi:hypothetical protein
MFVDHRPGPYTAQRILSTAGCEGLFARATFKELVREVQELKPANEILLAASSFFARELDPPLPW